jgi:iron complex outermembrane receptor protein
MKSLQRTLSVPLAASLAGVLVLGSDRPVVAQSAPVTLDPITVTARKRPEPLWEVPFSVDVETRNQLDERRVLDAAEALKDIGGAAMGTFGDRSNSFIVLRGVAPILTPLSPDDSSVLTFVDGAPLPISASNSSYLDLERVEVLKGPQSTLFGRNTSGGAVNLVPSAPTFKPEGYILGEYGTSNFYRIEGVVSGPIVPGKVAGRLALRRNGVEGYINNAYGPMLGGEGTWTGRASLLFTPTDRITWNVSVGMEDLKSTPVYYLLSPGPLLAAQDQAADNSKTWTAISKLEYAGDNFVATSQTSYTGFNNLNQYTYGDGFLMSALFGGALPPSFFVDPNQNYNVWNRNDSRLTQEFRVSSVPDSSFSWLAGLAYYRDLAAYTNNADRFGLTFFNPASSGYRTYNLDTTGFAGFGEITVPVPFIQGLKWSIGGRLAQESKNFRGQYFGGPFVAVGAVPYFLDEGSRNYPFWTGRTSLLYEWAGKYVTFANVSRGYKTGGFGTFNAQDYLGQPRQPYESASVMSYEIGARASLLNNRLNLQGAVFLNNVSNEQILGYDPVTFATLSLNVDTQSKGFELDATYKITKNWQLEAGVSYTDAKMNNVSALIQAIQPGVQSGNQLPNVPPWKARVALDMRIPGEELGLRGRLASGNLMGRIAYNFIDQRYSDAGNLGVVPAFHLLSGRIGFDWGGGEVYVFGNNLLDQRYMTVNQYFTYPPTIYGASYARGAVIGGGASVRF